MSAADCCGARLREWPDDDGADTAFCRGCNEETCSRCAAAWDVDGGYGDNGTQVRTFATCGECAILGRE